MKSILLAGLMIIVGGCATQQSGRVASNSPRSNSCGVISADRANKALEGVGLGLTNNWNDTHSTCADVRSNESGSTADAVKQDRANKAQEGIGIGLTNNWDRARDGYAANQHFFALQKNSELDRCEKLKKELEHEASLGIAYGLTDDRDRKYAAAGCN